MRTSNTGLSIGLLIGITALGLTGCSKHDCDFQTELDEHYWADLAEITADADMCLVSTSPYECSLEEIGCVPTLTATYYDAESSDVETHFHTFLEGQGWAMSQQREFEDGSRIQLFTKGEDELLLTVGFVGDFPELTLTRRPDTATSSIADSPVFND